MQMDEETGPLRGMHLMDVVVLYVEDDGATRQATAHMLARRLRRVYTAEDGLDGLKAFREHRPALVITDVMMPNMDGHAMCREIRAIDPEVPIIMLSANSGSEQLLKSIELGVFRYLVKPIKLADLINAISAVMEGIEKKKALGNALVEAQSALSFVEHDSELLQDYVERSMGMDLENFGNIRLHNIPMGTISGDFFCVARHSGDLYCLLADASGHGFSAMVPAMGIPRRFRQYAAQGFSLLVIADEINAILRSQGLTGHFIAATLARLTCGGQCVEVLNCGNPPALLIGGDGGLLHEFHSSTFPLGMADSGEMHADVERFELDARAALYLFSDGLVDTLQQALLDYEAIKRIFIDTAPVEVFDQMVKQAAMALLLGQPDDVTMVEVLIDQFAFASDKEPAAANFAFLEPWSEPEAEVSLMHVSVLVVEEDDDTRDFLVRTLGPCVGLVHVAMNGLEGLRKYSEHQPTLVISGVTMPGMNGIAMVEALRRHDADLPVIMTGELADHGCTEAMFDLGVSKFMQKPINAKKLLAYVRECVRRANERCGMRLSATAFEASAMGITIADKNREIVAVNAAFCNITGYTREEVIGRNPKLLSSGKHDAAFYQDMWLAINETGRWIGEIWNCRKNGELFLEWLSIAAVKDAEGRRDHYIAIFSDISENKLAEERLYHLAHHDHLTDLPNRILLHERLQQAILDAERDQEVVGLIYLGLDHFKKINDLVGHELSDDLLRLVARRMCDCVRDCDTVSRMGSDEFAILLPNVASRGTAWGVASKVLACFDQPCQVGQQELQLTTSIGISLYPSDADSTEALIKNAGNAMHQVKKKGRNSVGFSNFTH